MRKAFTVKSSDPSARVARMLFLALLVACGPQARAALVLKDPSDPTGYLARILINEAPFPGEMGYVSEENTKAAMLAVLWVLHSRIKHIPPGYSQTQIAAVKTDKIIDVITAGGEKGQCDGFYKDKDGRPAMVPRVEQRVRHLLGLANKGTPGRFARLLSYAQGLAMAYGHGGIEEADRFESLRVVNTVRVTGRAYSWMTDLDCYHPGGDFVRIPNDNDGVLGGNRFYTLRKK